MPLVLLRILVLCHSSSHVHVAAHALVVLSQHHLEEVCGTWAFPFSSTACGRDWGAFDVGSNSSYSRAAASYRKPAPPRAAHGRAIADFVLRAHQCMWPRRGSAHGRAPVPPEMSRRAPTRGQWQPWWQLAGQPRANSHGRGCMSGGHALVACDGAYPGCERPQAHEHIPVAVAVNFNQLSS